ncbi:MAG TPA: carboxypeptidase-like regulatory domain-containing protein [Planctomycetota bacterium]
MMNPWLAACLSVLCAGVPWCGAAESSSPEELIRLLDQGDFDQRAGAVRQLETLGEKAHAALQRAAGACESLEARVIVQRLLAELTKSSLHIRVVNADGKPVGNMEMNVMVSPPLPSFQRFAYWRDEPDLARKTDADGQILIENIEAGSSAYCSAAQTGTEPWSRAIWNVQPGQNRLLLVTRLGASLAGSVVAAADGKPVQGATLLLVQDVGQDATGVDPQHLWLQRTATYVQSQIVADADGKFVFEAVGDGSYFVFAEQQELAPACAGPIRVGSSGQTLLPAPIRMQTRAAVCGELKVPLLDEHGNSVKKIDCSVTITRLPDGTAPAGRDAGATPIDPQSPASLAWFRYMLLSSDRSVVQQENATDDDGALVLKDLIAGRYRIAIRTGKDNEDTAATYILQNVSVVAGQPAAAAAQKPQPCGTLSGSLTPPGAIGGYVNPRFNLWDSSIWALPEDDPQAQMMMTDVTRHERWLVQWRENSPYFGTRVQQNAFQFKRLPAGKYTVLIVRQACTKGVIHNVVVTAGKETKLEPFKLAGRAPDFKLPEKGISGRVLLPDGDPAKNARVGLVGEQGHSAQAFTNDKGFFTFNPRQLSSLPKRVVAALNGYRGCGLDLDSPDLQLDRLTLVLAQAGHGNIKLTVSDPDGQPLKGVLVAVQPLNATVSWGGSKMTSTQTDTLGRATLRGLAWGQRKLEFLKQGFYLPEPLTVAVNSEADADVNVRMKRGLKLAGRIEVPAGVDKTLGTICLEYPPLAPGYGYSWTPSFAAQAGADGRFEFTGLPPGEAHLNASFPGLTLAQSRVRVQVEPNGPEAALTLARTSSIALDLGSEFRGARVALVPQGTWDPARGVEHVLPPKLDHDCVADSRGQIVLRGLLPGTYDLLAKPSYEAECFHYTQHAAVAYVHPGVVVPGVGRASLPAKDRTAMTPAAQAGTEARPTPVRVQLSAAGVEVRGRVVIKNLDAFHWEEWDSGRLRVTIAGERVVGTCDLFLPEDVDPKHAPPEVGPRAKGFEMVPQEYFRFGGVPPGEYRIYFEYEVSDRNAPQTAKERFSFASRPIRTVRVGNTPITVLDDFEIELDPLILAKLRKLQQDANPDGAQWRHWGEDEQDIESGFQP